MCKDTCNCERGRANIDRLFCKCNHKSIPEPSGYSRGMATFYFSTNLVSLCARAAVVGREGGWSACSQASRLMALTFSLFCIFRISALKKQESNDSTHREELKSQSITATFRGFYGGNCRAESAVHHWPDQSTILVNDQFICETRAKCLHVVDLPTPKWDPPWIKKEVNSSNFTFKNLYKPLEVCGPF